MKFVALNFGFLTIVTVSLALDPEIERMIDKAVNKTLMEHPGTPAMGLVVVKGDGQTNDVMSKGYGFRDIKNNIKSTSNTLFAIGSLSKSFTATLVVKTLNETFPNLTIEESLEMPIKKLCPSCEFVLSDRYRSESTSFRDLLSHRIGVEDITFGLLYGAYKNKSELIYRHRYASETFPFRTNFAYHNGGPVIAGEMIATIANKKFEDMLTDMFHQIGMNDSRYVRDNEDIDGIPNMSKAYYRENNETKEFNKDLLKWASIIIGSGGIISTPDDMSKYLLMHLNDGKVGSTQVVHRSAMKSLRKFAIPLTHINSGRENANETYESNLAYGLGVIVGLQDGWQRVSHNGYLPPYYSSMNIYPGLKLGIFTVSSGPGPNSDDGVKQKRLHSQIFNIIQTGRNDEDENPSSTSSSPQIKFEAAKFDDIQQLVLKKDLVGVYGNDLQGELEISDPSGTSDDNLYLTYGRGNALLKRQTNSKTFVIHWEPNYAQLMYAQGFENGVELMNFNKANTVFFNSYIGNHSFVKGRTLNTLPFQPWQENSCGPSISEN